MNKELIHHNELPHAFSSRKLAGESARGLRTGELHLDDLELQKLHKINEVLSHPSLMDLIDEGKVTFALIKPFVNEGKNLPKDDDKAAQVIKDEIGEENIIFELPVLLTPEAVEEFYGELKERTDKIDIGNGKTVWNSIHEYGYSGPLTALLLYREEGDAVGWWREKMGKTKASEALLENPDSIRAKYAIEEKLPNNVTHGSDSLESVKRELSILRSVTEGYEQEATEASKRSLHSNLLPTLGF